MGGIAPIAQLVDKERFSEENREGALGRRK